MSIEDDPNSFVAYYGPTAVVKVGGKAMALGQALQMEALLCPADTTRRQDPQLRIGYLARMLYDGGSLQPAHQRLLPPPAGR